MKFKQIVYRGNAKLAAIDTLGKVWETRTEFSTRRTNWHNIPLAEDMKAPILSLCAQAERLLAIDGDRVLWQQIQKLGINTGEQYEWRKLDMPVIE